MRDRRTDNERWWAFWLTVEAAAATATTAATPAKATAATTTATTATAATKASSTTTATRHCCCCCCCYWGMLPVLVLVLVLTQVMLEALAKCSTCAARNSRLAGQRSFVPNQFANHLNKVSHI